MDVEIVVDKSCQTPRVVIHTNELTPEINELVNKLCAARASSLIGYAGGKAEILEPRDIIRVYAEQQHVYAQSASGVYTLKMRLYEAEERLKAHKFIRISNSELINIEKVKNLDLRYNGTICLNFKSGGNTFVSRRYMPKIKDYLGM